MAKIIFHASVIVTGLLVYIQYVECTTSPSPVKATSKGTTQESKQTTSAQTTQTSAQTTSTQTTQTSAQTSSAQTTQASAQTTSAQMTQTSTQTPASPTGSITTASSQRAAVTACPVGQFDQPTNTVTFIIGEKECQITVYLSKPPKGNKVKKAKKEKKEKKEKKAKKEKKGKKDKDQAAEQVQQQGQRFIEKNVAVGPTQGREFDQCPEIVVKKSGKDSYLMQTAECIMYVQKPKKSKDGSAVPVIMTDEVRQ